MINAQGLTKDYRSGKETVRAVDGIDLAVREGEFVAVLGPNGAGKSTTLRMLTSLSAPTSGTATVAGADVVRAPAAVRSRIGYVGQGNGGSHGQFVRDELRMQARIFGLGRAVASERVDELLEAFDLTDLARRKVSDLSGGQRRRLDVALGLVHRPQLLFLDEPTTGLDPHSRANLWEHIRRIRAETGMTILLTTHYLDEADDNAERVVVIDHGHLIADDSPARLKSTLAGDRIAFRADDAGALAVALADLAGSEPTIARDGEVSVRVPSAAAALPRLVRELDARGVGLTGATTHVPTLDDVFLTLTGRSLREQETASTAAQPTPQFA